MRTAIKETQVFSFNELSEDAKENAIRRLWDINVFYDWWDIEIDEFKEIGALMGIEIDEIYFSGFSSQRDGACFEGRYHYKPRSVKAIKWDCPLDTELHNIAQSLCDLQRPHFYRLSATVKHRGHYSHKYCTEIECFNNGDYYDSGKLEEILRDFMDWIYKRLERQYWFLVSDEAIIEAIEANEYEFDAKGKLY